MSITATLLSAVATRYLLQVDFPIAHRGTYLMENVTTFETDNAPAKLDTAAAHYENAIKLEWVEWLVADETRDVAIVSRVETRHDPYEDGWSFWDQTITFTLNGTMRITAECETPFEPNSPECDAAFQTVADAAVTAWFSARPQLAPLT